MIIAHRRRSRVPSLALHVSRTNEAVTTCCSDALTRSAGMSVELRLQCLRNLTDLLHRTFKGQFVFPALGHEDIGVNYTQLANLWQHWLPPEAVDTFVKGEQKYSLFARGCRIIRAAILYCSILFWSKSAMLYLKESLRDCFVI